MFTGILLKSEFIVESKKIDISSPIFYAQPMYTHNMWPILKWKILNSVFNFSLPLLIPCKYKWKILSFMFNLSLPSLISCKLGWVTNLLAQKPRDSISLLLISYVSLSTLVNLIGPVSSIITYRYITLRIVEENKVLREDTSLFTLYQNYIYCINQ